MVMDPEMKDIFKDGMVVAYKRHRNIRDFICRAKLYEIGLASNGRPSRAARKGWRKCPRCITCAHSENKVKLTCKAIGQSLQISQDITCKDCRVVYVIVCRQTGLWYIGKTAQSLMDRGRQHIQAVQSLCPPNNKLYTHFTTQGRSHADMAFFAVERVHGDDFVLAARERYYIDKFQTIYKGLNSKRT